MRKILKFIALLSLICFCGYLCIRSEAVSASVANALHTGVTVLMPSLFPFFVISDLLIKLMSNPGKIIARLYQRFTGMPACTFGAFICGFISGYPVGASSAYDLYENGIISKEEAERLICFVNNSGPLFIISAVGCGILGSLSAGVVLYVIHVMSALICARIFARNQNIRNSIEGINKRANFNLAYSIEKGFMQCIKVIGFVVFFAIITDTAVYLIDTVGLEKENIFLSGALCFLEITNGILMSVKYLNTRKAMCLISFACSFSGMSVLFQTALVTKGRLCLKKYSIMKLITGFISYCICSIYMIFKKDFGIIQEYKTDIIQIVMMGSCYIIFTAYLFGRARRKYNK